MRWRPGSSVVEQATENRCVGSSILPPGTISPFVDIHQHSPVTEQTLKKNMSKIMEKSDLIPRFDANGLIPCVVISARDNAVLMMAYMNAESLAKTIETREAHYWSRSRGEIWHKGATSGNVQKIVEMRIDCDQDCLLIKVEMPEPEISCHTGERSCFYRVIQS
jgi:phosphoribosyl-AMP cyclohydrolase